MHGIFVTGTNTGVGKTHISTAIARTLQAQGVRVVPRKPVESGCRLEGSELIPADAAALKNAAGYAGSLAQVCPYRFEPPISPLRAAHLANQALTTRNIAQACLANVDQDTEFLLVEGAGGFYSPLCEDGLNADLAQALGLPVLLVATDELGCINQVLLNVQAIESRDLTLLAVVLNNPSPHEGAPDMDNLDDLSTILDYPVISYHHTSPNSLNQLPEALIELIYP